MYPEHALAVEPQQVVKLSWHGMYCLFTLPVVIVVVGERLASVGVLVEGPEPVKVHVGTELQRQASHNHARAEPYGPQALCPPEACQALEVLWVEEDGPGGTVKVLDGVEGPERHRCVVTIGEGRQEHQGVAVAMQTLHKRSTAFLQTPISNG